MTLLLVLTAWFAVMNIIAFLVFRSDKKRAERGELRTPELTLHMLSLFGGAIGAFIGMRVCHHKTRKIAFKATVPLLMALQVLTWALVLALTIYASGSYHAQEDAKAALESDAQVTVTHKSNVYVFDGPGSENAFIFYPGGLVDADAYAPLMRKLADAGIDCFLVDMPYNLAFFGLNSASDIMAANNYDHWYIGGHSLGGVAASQFAVGHSQQLDGIVFLASYSTTFIPNNLKTLCIHGSNDGVINADAQEKNHMNLPSHTVEVTIQGGNHAQYGSYGPQKKDGDAIITADAQQSITARAIQNLVFN